MKSVAVIFRWVAVLPAAIVACLLIQVIAALAMTMSGLPDFYQQFVNSLCMGAAFVYVSMRIAPSHQFVTGLVMAAVFVVANTVLTTLALEHGVWSWWQVVCTLAGVASAVATAFVCRDEFEYQEPTQVTGWN